MAGIGFALQRLTRRDDLSGLAQAYASASLIASGPWLFTILSLGAINLFAGAILLPDQVRLFQIITIYNFAGSLIIAGPITLTVNRHLADQIFLGKVEEAPAMLLGALLLIFGAEAVIGIPFYFWACDMPPTMRVLALINFFIVGGIWLVSVFLSALKDYGSITRIFALGMAAAFFSSLMLVDKFGSVGLLAGFSCGTGVILFSLIARVLVEYPYRLTRPFGFLSLLRTHWELPVCGFLYNLAIWIDKFVMWTGPEHAIQARVMASFSAYDTAMFLAYISIVPGMTVFLVSVETRFYTDYLRFYKDLLAHATYAQIKANHRRIVTGLVSSLRNVGILQAVICFAVAIMAPALLDLLGIGYSGVSIFRFGVLGALCHAMLLFSIIVLSYFDLRRHLVFINLMFCVLNGGLTWISLQLGPGWYGYGYFLSALITLVVAYFVTSRQVARLPYLTFIGNNPGMRLS